MYAFRRFCLFKSKRKKNVEVANVPEIKKDKAKQKETEEKDTKVCEGTGISDEEALIRIAAIVLIANYIL